MENILKSGNNSPIALDGLAEGMILTGIEAGTDASTVAGDSGTVAVVVPPGAEGDLEDQKSPG